MSSFLHRKILSKKYTKISGSSTTFSVLTFCNKLEDYVSKQEISVGRFRAAQEYIVDLRERTNYPDELDTPKLNFKYNIAVKVNAESRQPVVNVEDADNPMAQALALAEEETPAVRSDTSDLDVSSDEELSKKELSYDQTKQFASALKRDLNVLLPRAGMLNPAIEKQKMAKNFLRFGLAVHSEKRIYDLLSAKRNI